MALYKFTKTQKYCALCNYWFGMRRVDSIWTPHQVIVEGSGAEEMGICANKKSWWNQKRKANQVCPYFDLWVRLKGY